MFFKTRLMAVTRIYVCVYKHLLFKPFIIIIILATGTCINDTLKNIFIYSYTNPYEQSGGFLR